MSPECIHECTSTKSRDLHFNEFHESIAWFTVNFHQTFGLFLAYICIFNENIFGIIFHQKYFRKKIVIDKIRTRDWNNLLMIEIPFVLTVGSIWRGDEIFLKAPEKIMIYLDESEIFCLIKNTGFTKLTGIINGPNLTMGRNWH